jgi:hypothetical protein
VTSTRIDVVAGIAIMACASADLWLMGRTPPQVTA